MCDSIDVRIVHLMIPITILALPCCKASVKADVNVSGQGGTEDDMEPFDEVMEAPAPPMAQHTEYFGVARRLTLGPGQRAASCACVAAVVGNANDPNFNWHGEMPGVGPDGLVIAISSEGIDCEQQGRGPSIAAIDRVGNDVVVVLEEFKDTRPIALGAIIPNPGPDGAIFLRARGRTPYGRPIGTAHGLHRNLCKVGTGAQYPVPHGNP